MPAQTGTAMSHTPYIYCSISFFPSLSPKVCWVMLAVTAAIRDDIYAGSNTIAGFGVQYSCMHDISDPVFQFMIRINPYSSDGIPGGNVRYSISVGPPVTPVQCLYHAVDC